MLCVVCFGYMLLSLTSPPSPLSTLIIKTKLKGPILENEIYVGDITLSPGNWEVYWFADLDTVGTDPLNPNNNGAGNVTTRHSTLTNFRVVGKYYYDGHDTQ